jgi:hypothetical protein
MISNILNNGEEDDDDHGDTNGDVYVCCDDYGWRRLREWKWFIEGD